ncbi:hypothetical protein ACFTRD_23615 [Paenibacillus sp. NPDC056933]|uniref:hypothetical protein n=1 Tax=Paenibacillus sp. NPDC056933 TaxID=3345968 RepID=UPI0036331C18
MIFVAGLYSSTIVAKGNMDNVSELTSSEDLDLIINRDALNEYNEDDEVPDIYGTSPETTFTFEVNGQVLQPGESIYIETAPGQQPIIRVGK